MPQTFTRMADNQTLPATKINELQAGIEKIDAGGSARVGNVVRPEDFGDPFTSTGHVAIQAAIDYINGTQDGGVVLFKAGTPVNYQIGATLTLYDGVSLWGEGWGGGGNLRFQWPVIAWKGVNGGTMVAQQDLTGTQTGKTGNGIRRLTFHGWNNQGGGLATDPVAGRGVQFYDRTDYGCSIQDCNFKYFRGSAIRYEDGGINIFLDGMRFDYFGENGEPAIYWRVGAADNFHVKDITFDNRHITQGATAAVTTAGLLTVDATTTPSNAHCSFSVENAKIETNCSYPANTGAITLKPKDGQGSQFQFDIKAVRVLPFGNSTETYAGSLGLTNVDGLVVYPDGGDYLMGSISNSRLRVRGIRGFQSAHRRAGTGELIPLAAIVPLTQRTGVRSTASGVIAEGSETAFEVGGDANVVGSYYQYGKKVVSVIQGGITATDWPTPITVDVGQEFMTTTTLTSATTSLARSICVTPGTIGTAPTATATTGAGNTVVTVSSTAEFQVGQYITFAGEGATENWRIAEVRPGDLSLVLHVATGLAAGSALAISWFAPTFKSWAQAVT